jgi:EAL domain-containing protein (putative c-di-GMP-specific phosphodiesterase class I)
VTELASQGANSELVSAIVALGRGLGLPIVAEGIENGEALEVLQKLGDIKGQGYHYGKPEDAEATLERLMAQASKEIPHRPARKRATG